MAQSPQGTHGAVVGDKLRRQLRIYAVIGVIMLVVIAVGLVRGTLTTGGVLAGTVIGVAIGWLLTRTSQIGWDTDAHRIVTNLDWIGGSVLVLYIVSVVVKDAILGRLFGSAKADFIHSAGLALTAGVMAGRVFSSGRAIRDVIVSLRPR